MSRLGTFNIEGVEYDLDDLTLDEMEEVETIAGAVFGEINYASTKGLKAFCFVLMKRGNPELTMADVGKVKVASFIEPEEEMPDLPPSSPETTPETEAESKPDDSGRQLSAVPTPGSPPSTSEVFG